MTGTTATLSPASYRWSARRPLIRSRQRFTAVVVGSARVGALSGPARLLRHAAAEHSTPPVATAPGQARGTISRVMGADQIAYRAVATARGLRLDNRRE